MLFSKDGNSDPTSENVEQEDKVKVEEASVNLGYVKKELNKEELAFEHKQYKIALTLENVFGESSTKQRRNRDGLIGFLDGDVIMKIETGTVKLEEENKDLIQKNMEQSDCNKCGGNYHGYCVNCSSLSHILNNLTPNFNPEPVLNTTPTNTLEIREVSRGCAVFALKTLPKGIILGPFEGTAPIESTTGLQWKIKNQKFVNDENGNWMKHIQTVANHASKNLDVFHIDGILYFETSREIQEGEELLVCYREEKEEMLESDKEEVFYLVPVKKDRYPKVFACTLCCLGFRLKNCLVEHRSKCPHGVNIEDFKIIQCSCCKVWLEEQEHLESHMLHCHENYNRSCRNRNLPEFPPTYYDEEEVDENDEITPSIDDVNASYSTLPTEPIESNNCFSRTDFKVQKDFHDKNMGTIPSNTSEKEYKCSECSYETNRKGYLRVHLGTHTKHFQCDICKQRFGRKSILRMHIKNKHSNTNEKEYKCTECSYQTNHKGHLKVHLVSHTHVKDFQCDICKQRFGRKSSLKKHIKYKHSNTNEKEYKCSECSFQTNHKCSLKIHLSTHSDIKHFECDICKQRFTQKRSLIMHTKNKHSNTNEKEFKCSECSYQTNWKGHLKHHMGTVHSNTKEKEYKCSECSYETNLKGHLKTHLGTHTQHFQCDICKQRFGHKISLKVHMKDKHSNTNEKEYKCSECSYQTNRKANLKSHLGTHTDVKDFQCDICKQRFGRKDTLIMHIKMKHSNTNEKEYKCSKCSYQTNHKGNLNLHLVSHTDLKHFQCDICKQRFAQKGYLKVHIKIKHSNANEKEYKCSECSYQTNIKSSLKTHLGTHTQHFQCDICKQRFGHKISLKVHIKDKHSNTNEKEYKCSKCSYQTNHKGNLNLHLVSHTDLKHFQCDICKQRFAQKSYLKMHIKLKHSNPNEKEYKCSECSYQTNVKGSLKTHLGTHTQHFQCDICKQRFGHKISLKVHIKDKHSNTNEKEYKCSECSYQTNIRGSLKFHLGTHTDAKDFQCDICKQRFGLKGNLKRHIQDKHSNTSEKEYKCCECSYQTNSKRNYKLHLGTHTDIKNFECDICKRRFTQKSTLTRHIKNKHSNTNEK